MKIFSRSVNYRLFFFTIICVLPLITMGCSGSTKPGQPFIVPFNSKYITTDKVLTVSPALHHEGSSERNFLSITQQTYLFENGNSTAKIQVLLNRKASINIPEIGEWSTVSTGNCLSSSKDVECFTAHVDCHLVRTTSIRSGNRSVIVIKVQNRAREPQELCEQWDFFNLSDEQKEEVSDFNKISDLLFSFKLPPPEPIKRPENSNHKSEKKPSS
ncbi:hypothetical protein [Maridesulfovibrio zosterae]|uniref:hypothetical protein n=1 Tax=Maridesulfovibrio zosterae TaxID=82171 RepID=UPI0004209839|nr:hypothetical protein [Maridesulfovibrio zosterae]